MGDSKWMELEIYQMMIVLSEETSLLEEEDLLKLTKNYSKQSIYQQEPNENLIHSDHSMENLTIKSLKESAICPCKNLLTECPFCSNIDIRCVHGLRTFCKICRALSRNDVMNYIRNNAKYTHTADICENCKEKYYDLKSYLTLKDITILKNASGRKNTKILKKMHVHHLEYIPPFRTKLLCSACHGLAHSLSAPHIPDPDENICLRVEFINHRKPVKKEYLQNYNEYYSMIGLRFFKKSTLTYTWIKQHRYYEIIPDDCKKL
jgi:hypothetical protein